MKNFKKFSWLMLAPLMVSILACGPSQNTTSDIDSDPETSETPAEVITKTTLKTYEGPKIMHTSKQCQIFVEGEELFVYETRVNHKRVFSWSNDYGMSPYSYFDFEGQVDIKIVLPETVTSAKVSPLAHGIDVKASGNAIEFSINQPDSYVIEYNGDSTKAITLFANPLEKNIPDKNDPNVVFIEPGLYDAGAIPLSSGKTLYISGGAYVFGQIRTEMQNNIKICGRGIISGETYSREGEGDKTVPLELRYGKNIEIEGIIFADPAGWATTLYGCEDVHADNVKIMTARPNGDGWSIQGCKNVLIENGYVRTWDDSLVVKCNDGLPTDNVKFNGVNVWTDLAQSMEVGFEANADYMKNVTFENITVIHAFHKAPISIHNADKATVSNIKYENITVEHGEMLGDNRSDNENDFLIDFSILYHTDWSKNENLGDVSKVTVRNVDFVDVAPSCVTRISGDKTAQAIMSDVLFDSIKINGKDVTSLDELKVQQGDNVANVNFKAGTATGCKAKKIYDVSKLTDELQHSELATVEQDAIIVPDFAKLKGDLQYLGEPIDYKIKSVSVTHGVGNKFNSPADDGTGDHSSTTYPVKNLTDKDHSTLFESKTYPGDEDEFFALTVTFEEAVFVGNARLFGTTDNNYSYQYDINTRVQIDPNKGFRNAVSKKTYKLAPSSGNCIDIAMSATEIYAVQFRIFPAKDEYFAINKLSFAELELFGPSLSYRKSVLDATEHSDVYDPERLTDGNANGTSYYESKGFPASFVIDLGDVYNVKVISLNLPASLMWDPRSQEIQLDASNENSPYDKNSTQFTTFVEKTSFLFDPQSGNKNVLTFENPVSMRYLKVTIFSNDIAGNYGAQLSEVYVFGSK